MPSQRRISATVQFVIGRDDDLITWLESLPEKGRNQAMKNLMRAGLNLPQPTNGHVSEHQLELLRHEWEQWKQGVLADLPGYISQLVGQNGAIPLEPQIEPVEQLSQIELQNRAAKIRNVKW